MPPASSSRSSRIETSAKSRGGRVAVPAKITSSMPPPRRLFGLPSPIAQRIASNRLDLPQPFGPTIPVSPGSTRSSDGSTKLLKPLSFSRRIFKALPPDRLRSTAQRVAKLRLQQLPGGGLFDQFAVDRERRRAGEGGMLGGRVAGHLHELLDLRLVRQALLLARRRQPPLRRPRLEPGKLGIAGELLGRRKL